MTTEKKICVGIILNGSYREAKVKPSTLLVELLRDHLHMTGTKYGCGEGECGACTVLMEGKPVNSCLVLAISAQGKEILTVEGLEQNGLLHPIQQAFLENGAFQCGFCTPGMLISAYALLKRTTNPTDMQIREALSGNLCRCTGYQKIFDAVHKAAAMIREQGRE